MCLKHSSCFSIKIWSYQCKIPIILITEISIPGPVFCLLLWVSSDYAQPITGQVTEVTCPVIGRAQPELTLSRDRKWASSGFNVLMLICIEFGVSGSIFWIICWPSDQPSWLWAEYHKCYRLTMSAEEFLWPILLKKLLQFQRNHHWNPMVI